MRTRSSRFFVILLHLVGVSRHLPSPVVGVQPWPIVLEELQLPTTEPLWIQDAEDGSCLGPNGDFVECGDATQWMVSKVRTKLITMNPFGMDATDREGWKFHVVDFDTSLADRISQSPLKRRQASECLAVNRQQAIAVEKCQKLFGNVAWELKDDGSLVLLPRREQREVRPKCLFRDNHHAVLEPCATRSAGKRKVLVSLVRYRAGTASSYRPSTSSSSRESSNKKRRIQLDEEETETDDTMPFLSSPSRDIAHEQASEHQSRRIALSSSSKVKLSRPEPKGQPLKALYDTNLILLVHGRKPLMEEPPKRPTSLEPAYKARKIEVHPYIAAAKNEVWTDPQTGLTYSTDLCKYLGHDQKERGRHTLMGVGQYRKGFVIKVYGIALYVSKRDALADPTLAKYAGLSADQLRQRPDFYDLLQRMGDNGPNVDRTLLLKTNIQLSAETMRSSLQADWRYLTEEAKSTLINSSMQPRPADEDMLKVITSPDNPSRCSCSQVAPEEYHADPGCCARGTELVFTWLKSGDLEVRLNGRVMEVFPRPDIAAGIFFEYLRTDDPMSSEFRERVMDGFPFLLGPLAHLKGVSISQPQPSVAKSSDTTIMRMLNGWLETATTGAMSMAAISHRAMTEAATKAGNMARVMGETALGLGKELDRRRDLLLKHRVSLPQTMRQLSVLPQTVFGMIARGEHVETIQALTSWVATNITPTNEHAQELQTVRRESLGRAFGYPLSRWFSETYQAPDEIGPMKINPTMNTTRRIFLAFVHVYLLLLFIVSFPGSYTTKLIVRKRGDRSLPESASESSFDKKSSDLSSLGDASDALSSKGSKKSPPRHVPRRSIFSRARQALRPSVSDKIPDEILATNAGGRLKKKSLSYFL